MRPSGLAIALVSAVVGISSAYAPSIADGLKPRATRLGEATATLALNTRPPSLADSERIDPQLQLAARLVERLAWAPATLRRAAGAAGLPSGEVLGTAAPSRVEQVSERRSGTRDQRAYAVVRTRKPYELSADVYIRQPLVRLTVRGPDAKSAAKLLSVMPESLNAELDRLAGGSNLARYTVANRGGVAEASKGISPAIAALGIGLATMALLVLLRTLVRANRATVATGPSLSRTDGVTP